MSGRKGNLVKNPSFELGLRFWDIPRTMVPTDWYPANVSIYEPRTAHSGGLTAWLGLYTAPAVLSQDVRVAERRFYELHFHVAADTETEPGSPDLKAEVRWLTEAKDDLGQGLAIFVPRYTIGVVWWPPRAGPSQWSAHARLTSESPEGASFARIVFTTDSRTYTDVVYPSPSVLLDDVYFADQS